MTGSPQLTPTRSPDPGDARGLARKVAFLLIASIHERLAESDGQLPTAELLSIARILTAASRELPPDDDPPRLPACADPPSRSRHRNRRRAPVRDDHGRTDPGYASTQPAGADDTPDPRNPCGRQHPPGNPNDRP
ncbi:MAG: hypothetical protein ACE5EX_05805, partial [Phycisphaerae bacterium]